MLRNRHTALVFVFGLLSSAALLTPGTSLAHPMGNFSINHYTKIIVAPRAIELDYIIDMAEIPTFQEIQRSEIVPKANDPSLAPYLTRQAETLKGGLSLTAESQTLQLETISRQVIFPPGAGGLPTMKIGFVYHADLQTEKLSSPVAIHYQDNNFPGRAGWKEIITGGNRGAVLVASSVPLQDRSAALTNYPTDLLHSPPQILAADLTFRAAGAAKATTVLGPARQGGAASLDAPARADSSPDAGGGLLRSPAAANPVVLGANRQGTQRSAFTELIASEGGGVMFLLMAAVVAAALGGFHALEPGHGKTLVAAYLVGSRGTARHAVLLGGVVTVTHTISVYVLGLLTLYASQWILPERLYPWFGMASGVLVAAVGLTMFIRRFFSPSIIQPGGEDYPDDHHLSDHSNVHRHTWWGGHIHGNRLPHVHDHRHHEDLGHHAHANFDNLHAKLAHDNEGHSGSRASDHSHDDHSHDDGFHHAHDDGFHYEQHDDKVSLNSLLALGVTGGIVPCPAALVVLLGALALHRVAFGLFLIVAFSFGLAGVLIGFGLAMVYARRFMARFKTEGPLTRRWLPLASAAVITLVGIGIALQSLMSAGILARL